MLIPLRATLLFVSGQSQRSLEQLLGYNQADLIDTLLADVFQPLSGYQKPLTAKAKLEAARSFAKAELRRIAGVRN